MFFKNENVSIATLYLKKIILKTRNLNKKMHKVFSESLNNDDLVKY